MPDRDDFERDIELTRSLGSLATAYEELAVMRIQRIRQAVLATREFREGLVDVFAYVRASRQREVLKLLDKQRQRRGIIDVVRFGRGEAASSDATGKKKAITHVKVLLSADERLSGGVTRDVFQRFVADLDKDPSAVAVIGEVGQALMKRLRPRVQIAYYHDMPDEHASVTELEPLIRFLLRYDDVTIYFGKFVNLVDQIATAAKLFDEARLIESPGSRTPEREEKYFLFEPSLAEVVEFFDTNIFAMLFKQTLDEALLALLGSRITAMEEAGKNITQRVKELELAQRQRRRSVQNKKQRQALAGMELWGG